MKKSKEGVGLTQLIFADNYEARIRSSCKDGRATVSKQAGSSRGFARINGRGKAMKQKTTDIFVAVLSCAVAGLGFILLYLKFVNFDPSCTDFTIFKYFKGSISNTLFHGQPLDSTIILLTAFSQVTTLLAAVYSVIDSYLIVIAFETFLTGLTVWVIYRLSCDVTENHFWSAVLAVGYALNPLVDFYATVGFKPEVLGNLAVATALLGYRKADRRLFVACLITALLSKIEYLPVAVLLCVWFYWRAKDARFFKAAVKTTVSYFIVWAALSGTAFFLAPKALVLHYTAFDLMKGPFVSSFSETVIKVFSGLIDLRVLKIFLPALPVLFLPFLSPSVFLLPSAVQLAASAAVWKWYSELPAIRDIILNAPGPVSFFYDGPRAMVVWLPFIYFAAALGLKTFLTRFEGRAVRVVLAGAVMTSTVLCHVIFISPVAGPWPTTAYWDAGRYRQSDRHRLLKEEIEKTDVEGVKVALTLPLHMYLNRSDFGNIWNIPYGEIPDEGVASRVRILIDLYLCTGFPHREEVLDWIKKALNGPYSVSRFEDGIVVLENGTPGPGNQKVLSFMEKHADVLERTFFDYREYQRRIGEDCSIKLD